MGWFSFRWITVPSEWILVESLVEKNFEGQGTRYELDRFQKKKKNNQNFLFIMTFNFNYALKTEILVT